MTNKKNFHYVLVADPEPVVRDTLKIKLMSKGYKVILSGSGKEMIITAGKEKPDVIITEINFKDIDMFRACQALKGNPRTKDIPIIVLTHEGDSLDRKFLFSPYVAKFMSKPFSPREVEKAVGELLSKCGGTASVE